MKKNSKFLGRFDLKDFPGLYFPSPLSGLWFAASRGCEQTPKPSRGRRESRASHVKSLRVKTPTRRDSPSPPAGSPAPLARLKQLKLTATRLTASRSDTARPTQLTLTEPRVRRDSLTAQRLPTGDLRLGLRLGFKNQNILASTSNPVNPHLFLSLCRYGL